MDYLINANDTLEAMDKTICSILQSLNQNKVQIYKRFKYLKMNTKKNQKKTWENRFYSLEQSPF